VIASHIKSGKDFYEWEPKERWDVIVSNPPFSKKRETFERALSFGKPFALLMSNTWMNDAAPAQLFKERDLQLLLFDKRIRFVSPNGEANDKVNFGSAYWCCDFLPKQIVMMELKPDDRKTRPK